MLFPDKNIFMMWRYKKVIKLKVAITETSRSMEHLSFKSDLIMTKEHSFNAHFNSVDLNTVGNQMQYKC